jgi:ferredoxin-NADP reductase
LRVAEIDAESSSVTSFRLDATGETPAAAPLPGQFVTLRLRLDPSVPALLRCYSLSGLPDSVRYRISAEREPSGAASQYLCGKVAVGDVLEVATPRGSFVLAPGERPVVLVSAGVGATPVLAMLHTLAEQGASRPVWWLHGARNHREHAFADEVDLLLASLPDAHRVVCYSRPDTDPASDPRFDVAGRMSARTLDEAGVPADADFYLCGPESFMHDIGAALIARGAKPERIRTERFGSEDALRPGVVHQTERPPHPPAGRPGTPGLLWPQRPQRAMGSPVRQPAGAGRGVRRAGPLQLPHRRLPHLRDRRAERRDHLSAGAARATGARQRPGLLRHPDHRARPGPLAPTPEGSKR